LTVQATFKAIVNKYTPVTSLHQYYFIQYYYYYNQFMKTISSSTSSWEFKQCCSKFTVIHNLLGLLLLYTHFI